MSAETRQAVIDAVQAHFADIKSEVERRLVDVPGFEEAEVRAIQTAQNVLRLCLEATLDKLLPYSEVTCSELAIRLASYAISAAPAEDQPRLVAGVVVSFPEAHARRLEQGVRLTTTWDTQGRERGNFPERDS